MCRSIKVLRRPGQPASLDELNGAALQFVRKISGMNKPSKMNQQAFYRAVHEIAGVSRRLLTELTVPRERPEPVTISPAPALNTEL